MQDASPHTLVQEKSMTACVARSSLRRVPSNSKPNCCLAAAILGACSPDCPPSHLQHVPFHLCGSARQVASQSSQSSCLTGL